MQSRSAYNRAHDSGCAVAAGCVGADCGEFAVVGIGAGGGGISGSNEPGRGRDVAEIKHEIDESWTDEQKKLYVRVYRWITVNQHGFSPVGIPTVPTEIWDRLAHNAAWVAADMLVSDELTIYATDSDEVVAQSPHGLNS